MIARNRIGPSLKDSPRKPLRRRPYDTGIRREREREREKRERERERTKGTPFPPSSLFFLLFLRSQTAITDYKIGRPARQKPGRVELRR